MKKGKKRKFKKLYWVPICLAVAVLILILTTHRPRRYRPAPAGGDDKPSPCLTHVLLPDLYNGAQLGEPFELVVTQDCINDIIVRSKWPVRLNDITFSGLQVFLSGGQVLMMATANIKGIDFVFTSQLNPILDKDGLLTLHIATVKIGAVSITPLARIIAGKIYAHRLGPDNADSQNLTIRITRSVINNEPFEPVFRVEDKKLRIEKVDISQQRIATLLVPLPD